jgi:dienelactone hydrolase
MSVHLSRPSLAILALAVLAVAAGCGLKKDAGAGNPGAATSPHPEAIPDLVAVTPLPDFGQGRLVLPKIVRHEVSLTTGGLPGDGQLWLYLPEKPPAQPLPCVLISAGPSFNHGSALVDGDRPEHLDYASAGFAVVAYAVSGNVPSNHWKDGDPVHIAACREYRDSGAGVADARRAFDYLAAKIPAVDPKRVFAAGSHLAASLSLRVAEHEPRLAGCVAVAPWIDVGGVLNSRQNSPGADADTLRCPLFLFQVDRDAETTDESFVPRVAHTIKFAERVKEHNEDVTFVMVPRGDRNDLVDKEGLPRARRWLQERAGIAKR